MVSSLFQEEEARVKANWRTGRPSFKFTALLLVSAVLPFFWSCAGGPSTEELDLALVREIGRMTVERPAEGDEISEESLILLVDFSEAVADLTAIEAFDVEIATVGEEGEVLRVNDFSREGARFSMALSLSGARDGTDFSLRVHPIVSSTTGENLDTAWSDPRRWRLSIGLPKPEPTRPIGGEVFLGLRPVFAWRVSKEPIETDTFSYVFELDTDDAFASPRTVRTDTTTVDTVEPLDSDRPWYWRVYTVGVGGVVGPYSTVESFTPSQTVVVTSPLQGDFPGIVRRPALRWNALNGATGYEVELSSGETVRSFYQEKTILLLDEDILTQLLSFENSGTANRTITWRIRARTAGGEFSPWTESGTLTYEPSAPAMITVLPVGEIARPTLGNTIGNLDERPPVQVTLTRPYAISRTEVTNRLVEELVNLGLELGVVYEKGEIVYDRSTDLPLLGLGSLTTGEQWGFLVDRDGTGRMVALRGVPGRESHPAVGISWYGAQAIAEALTYLSGFDRTHRFRLPTEAEWRYAADRVFPDGFSATGYSGGRVNFLRSGDPYEDPHSPYTTRGGPTVPVSFLANGGRLGIYDLLGNVWEWCTDWYDPAAFTMAEGTVNPSGPAAAIPDMYGLEKRVVRGGAWNTTSGDLRIGKRGSYPPDSFSHSIGVRLVRTLP